jgi:hypothetical protein
MERRAVIDLKGDVRTTANRIQLCAARSAEHHCLVVNDVVHGQDDRSAVDHDPQSPEKSMLREQLDACSPVEYLEALRLARLPVIIA